MESSGIGRGTPILAVSLPAASVGSGPSILHWDLFHAVNDQHLYRDLAGFELKAKLLLYGRIDGGADRAFGSLAGSCRGRAALRRVLQGEIIDALQAGHIYD